MIIISIIFFTLLHYKLPSALSKTIMIIIVIFIIIMWLVRDTGDQSQVESYQRLIKWYLISPCLRLSIIRCVSRVKWSNPGKGVGPSPTPWCSSYWKGNHLVAPDYGRQLYLLIYIYIWWETKNYWHSIIMDNYKHYFFHIIAL